MKKIIFHILFIYFSLPYIYGQTKAEDLWPNGKLKARYSKAGAFYTGIYKSYYADGKTLKAKGHYKKSDEGFNEGREIGYFFKSERKHYDYTIDGKNGAEQAVIYDSLGNVMKTLTLTRTSDKKNKLIMLKSQASYANGKTRIEDNFIINTYKRTYKEFYENGKLKREIQMSLRDSSKSYPVTHKHNFIKNLGYLDQLSLSSTKDLTEANQIIGLSQAPELMVILKEYDSSGTQSYGEDQEPYRGYVKQHYKQWFNSAGKPVLDSVWVADTLHRVWKHYYILRDTFWIYSTLCYQKDTFNFMNGNGFYEEIKRATDEKKENEISILFKNPITDTLLVEINREQRGLNWIPSPREWVELEPIFPGSRMPRILPYFLPNAVYYDSEFLYKLNHTFIRNDPKKRVHKQQGTTMSSAIQFGYYKNIDRVIILSKANYKNKTLSEVMYYSDSNFEGHYEPLIEPCDHRVPSSPCFTDKDFYFFKRDTEGDRSTFILSKDPQQDSNIYISTYREIAVKKYSPKYIWPTFELRFATLNNNYFADTIRQLIGDTLLKVKRKYRNVSHSISDYLEINLKQKTAYIYTRYSLSPHIRDEYFVTTKEDIGYNYNLGDLSYTSWKGFNGIHKTYSHDGSLYREALYKNGKLIWEKINKKHPKFCKDCPDYY